PCKGTTADETIAHLRSIFSRFGIPKTLVTDNGPAFVGREMREFTSKNNVKHVYAPYYHPNSNGLAERAVGIIKKKLKQNQEGLLQLRLDRILFQYRNATKAD